MDKLYDIIKFGSLNEHEIFNIISSINYSKGNSKIVEQKAVFLKKILTYLNDDFCINIFKFKVVKIEDESDFFLRFFNNNKKGVLYNIPCKDIFELFISCENKVLFSNLLKVDMIFQKNNDEFINEFDNKKSNFFVYVLYSVNNKTLEQIKLKSNTSEFYIELYELSYLVEGTCFYNKKLDDFYIISDYIRNKIHLKPNKDFNENDYIHLPVYLRDITHIHKKIESLNKIDNLFKNGMDEFFDFSFSHYIDYTYLINFLDMEKLKYDDLIFVSCFKYGDIISVFGTYNGKLYNKDGFLTENLKNEITCNCKRTMYDYSPSHNESNFLIVKFLNNLVDFIGYNNLIDCHSILLKAFNKINIAFDRLSLEDKIYYMPSFDFPVNYSMKNFNNNELFLHYRKIIDSFSLKEIRNAFKHEDTWSDGLKFEISQVMLDKFPCLLREIGQFAHEPVMYSDHNQKDFSFNEFYKVNVSHCDRLIRNMLLPEAMEGGLYESIEGLINSKNYNNHSLLLNHKIKSSKIKINKEQLTSKVINIFQNSEYNLFEYFINLFSEYYIIDKDIKYPYVDSDRFLLKRTGNKKLNDYNKRIRKLKDLDILFTENKTFLGESNIKLLFDVEIGDFESLIIPQDLSYKDILYLETTNMDIKSAFVYINQLFIDKGKSDLLCEDVQSLISLKYDI